MEEPDILLTAEDLEPSSPEERFQNAADSHDHEITLDVLEAVYMAYKKAEWEEGVSLDTAIDNSLDILNNHGRHPEER